MNMVYSRSGLHLTELFEGCKLVAYRDSGGIPTIGYGHTKNVFLGMTCSQMQAEEWLMDDVQDAAADVNRLVKCVLTQPEFDAIVDFVFNIGGGHKFLTSTMLGCLNRSDYVGAANEFERWDKCNGQVVAGLLRRRQAERQEFVSGMASGA